MPNTAVKPLYAESTRLETVREDRELPVKKIPHLMDAEFFYVSAWFFFIQNQFAKIDFHRPLTAGGCCESNNPFFSISYSHSPSS